MIKGENYLQNIEKLSEYKVLSQSTQQSILSKQQIQYSFNRQKLNNLIWDKELKEVEKQTCIISSKSRYCRFKELKRSYEMRAVIA